ncbi:MAG: DUF6478 family protein [Phaeovulum sp.]|uniref:DUF6478 family protein n=1 Tax=Phaeovulum sp. TaxID=2934796 RepID=UPI002731C835|nr:DUF6478 family protein [Phaeovulum sp.]MDP2063528.1 DUF6478 family protein [Phaeovulum sp.]
MDTRSQTYLDRLLQRRALARWRRASRLASQMRLGLLRSLRDDAVQTRREIDRLLHVADARLTLPLIGSDAIRRPLGADWAWRPALWRGPVVPVGHSGLASRAMLGDEATVFHDCTTSELTAHQIRNRRETDLAPYGLRLDVFHFDGSFLSLVLDLPSEAVQGLRRNHLIRLDCLVEVEKPLEIFARLNIRSGPNTEQLVRELPLQQADTWVEFDLAYTKMNEKRVDKAWIDLIFEGPEMNQIVIRDLTLSRRPRADL